MRFVLFCPSGIVPAQFAALSTGSVGNVTCIGTEEELRNKLRHRPQSVVISAGRPAECAEMWFRFYRDHSFVVVLCVAPFFLPPDVSISGVLKNLRLLKPGMSVEHVISIANSSGGLSGLKHAENLPVMDSYSVFMKEVNNRTKDNRHVRTLPGKAKEGVVVASCRTQLGIQCAVSQNGDKTDMACRAVAKKALGNTGQHVIAGSPAAEQQ